MKIYDRLLIVLAVFITMTPLSQADGFNPSVWEKPSQNQLRQTLNELQYYVTQQEGTEKPFHNATGKMIPRVFMSISAVASHWSLRRININRARVCLRFLSLW